MGQSYFFSEGLAVKAIFQQGEGFFLQPMLYNSQLGRIEGIYFQRREKQSRKFISTGGEH